MTASNFYRDVILKDPRHASTDRISDIALLEPGTRIAVQNLIRDAAANGFEVKVLETYRSPARQAQLFKQGATKLKAIGCHSFGVACDLGHFVKGTLDGNGTHYAVFQGLCARHGLIWGGDWGAPKAPHSFRDYDHVQRVPIFRQTALFAGTWYPPAVYDPTADMIAHAKSAAA